LLDDGLDSLRSDGIPVGDDLSGEREQYIWSDFFSSVLFFYIYFSVFDRPA
jgi:hypothetical protein